MANISFQELRKEVEKFIERGATSEEIDSYIRKSGMSPEVFARINQNPVEGIKQQQEYALIGTGRGLTNAYESGRQLFEGVDSDFSRKAQNERELYARAKAKESPTNQMSMGIGELIGETAPYTLIPAGSAGATLPARLAATGGAGLGIGSTQFVNPKELQPEGEYDPRRSELGIRTGRGGAGLLAATGTTLGLQLPRMASSKMTGGYPSQQYMKAKPSDAADEFKRMRAQRALVETSKREDVPLSGGDIVRGGPGVIEEHLEEAPVVGLGQYRRRQQLQAEKAGARLVEKQNIGEDWPIMSKEGLIGRLESNKRWSRRQYEEISKLSEGTQIPLPNTFAALDEVIAHHKSRMQPNTELIKELETMRDALTTARRTGKSSFNQVKDHLLDVGERVDTFYRGQNTLIGSRGAQDYQAISRAIEADMETFSKKQGGEIWEKWRTAQNFRRENVVPYRTQSQLRALAREDDPSKLYKMFLGATHMRPTVMYKHLNAKGRQGIRAGMIQDAFDNAMKNPEGFQPHLFAAALERRQKELGIFFKGHEAAQIKGLANLMAHAERAGYFAKSPSTFRRLEPWVIAMALGGIGVVGSPKSAALAAGGLWGLSKFMTSDTGRRFLIGSSMAKPGPQMQKVIDNYAPRIATLMEKED